MLRLSPTRRKPYSPRYLTNRLILGDALAVLPLFPPQIADLVFLDPPYALRLPRRKRNKLRRWGDRSRVEGVFAAWDQFSDFAEYDQFMTRLLSELRRVMKPHATLWVVGTYHSIYRIGRLLQDLGFWILNDVIWVKTNPMPNWLGVRFTNATETLLWASLGKGVKPRNEKNPGGYYFNRAYAKQFGLRKAGSNLWEIPTCVGRERLRDSQGRRLHPTQKPLELLRRVLLTTTEPGALVLDPMAGVGTTGVAALELGRRFILIEREPRYAEAAELRLRETRRRLSSRKGAVSSG